MVGRMSQLESGSNARWEDKFERMVRRLEDQEDRISDLHEQAVQSGWRRAFENAGRSYQIESIIHATHDLDAAARGAKLRRQWRIVDFFGESEREIFARACKLTAFNQYQNVPAILCTCWTCP